MKKCEVSCPIVLSAQDTLVQLRMNKQAATHLAQIHLETIIEQARAVIRDEYGQLIDPSVQMRQQTAEQLDMLDEAIDERELFLGKLVSRCTAGRPLNMRAADGGIRYDVTVCRSPEAPDDPLEATFVHRTRP